MRITKFRIHLKKKFTSFKCRNLVKIIYTFKKKIRYLENILSTFPIGNLSEYIYIGGWQCKVVTLKWGTAVPQLAGKHDDHTSRLCCGLVTRMHRDFRRCRQVKWRGKDVADGMENGKKGMVTHFDRKKLSIFKRQKQRDWFSLSANGTSLDEAAWSWRPCFHAVWFHEALRLCMFRN